MAKALRFRNDLRRTIHAGTAALVLLVAPTLHPNPATNAQTATSVDESILANFRWRNIGPLIGGPTQAPAGSPSTPHVFYVAGDHGGVWKTNDAGRTWRSVFEGQPASGIGAIAVAPDTPDVIYAGTWQDEERGAGLYGSRDGGVTWTHAGLAEAQRIAAIVVTPGSPHEVHVAVAGGPEAAGVYTRRGDADPVRTLAPRAGHGIVDLEVSPRGPVMYAVAAPEDGVRTGSAPELFRSVDGGRSWERIDDRLPIQAANHFSIDVALAGPDAETVYALAQGRMRAEVYRSDDAGASWARVWHEDRAAGGDDTLRLAADPRHRDVVYLTGPRLLRSTDGGRSFAEWGGIASQASDSRIWLHPSSAGAALLTTRDGALVTLNDGETWSSTENQPTGSYEQLSTDAAFPYRVCASRPPADVVCVPSRPTDGQGTEAALRLRLERPPAIAPDPADGDVLYLGSVLRFDRRTGQGQMLALPPEAIADDERPDVLLAAPTDSRTIYFASRGIWKSANAGQTWASVGLEDRTLRIVALAPSPVDGQVVWAADSTGQLWLTRNQGSTWSRVVLPVQASEIATVAASRFDPNGAYITLIADAGNRTGFLTRDGGRTWTSLVTGLPPDVALTAIAEDAFRRGLLFAGSSDGPIVSFDDGHTWQSIRLNLPPATVTSVTIREADVVIATRGRGIWVLDDITPLRQLTADTVAARAFLLRPATAWRMRRAEHAPAALSPALDVLETPGGGALLGYHLGAASDEAVTIEIIETATGEVIRRFPEENGEPLARTAGLHRIRWDLRYAPLTIDGSRTVAGPQVAPGTYQIRLTMGSIVQRQAVVVRMDPRVRASAADLSAQTAVLKRLYRAMRERAANPARVAEAAALVPLYSAIDRTDARPSAVLAAAVDSAIGPEAAVARQP